MCERVVVFHISVCLGLMPPSGALRTAKDIYTDRLVAIALEGTERREDAHWRKGALVDYWDYW